MTIHDILRRASNPETALRIMLRQGFELKGEWYVRDFDGTTERLTRRHVKQLHYIYAKMREGTR